MVIEIDDVNILWSQTYIKKYVIVVNESHLPNFKTAEIKLDQVTINKHILLINYYNSYILKATH